MAREAYRASWRAENRERLRVYAREYYAKNRERILAGCRAWHKTPAGARYRWRKTLRKYGLSQESWDALWARQEGTCAGCGVELEPGPGTHIDHCHETGAVRGVLCSACNLALGKVKDCAETLRRLADYVDRAKARQEA